MQPQRTESHRLRATAGEAPGLPSEAPHLCGLELWEKARSGLPEGCDL